MSRTRAGRTAKDAPRPPISRSPAPAARPAGPAPFLSPWIVAGPFALLLALGSARGAPLGTPICDDYAFLDRLAFARPLDWLGSMGAAFYWRPIARQLYYSVLGPGMLHTPWVIAAVHAALFLAVFALAWDLARRSFAAPVAAAIATFPIVSESTRMLLGWPSAAQHLLAILFALLALREARHGRAWTAGAAIVAGLLCHEAAIVALPFALVLLARRVPGPARARLVATLPVLVVCVAWAVVYRLVLARGVTLPPHATEAAGPAGFARLVAYAVPALLNLEDVGGAARTALVVGYVALFAWAAVRLATGGTAAQRRFKAARPALVLGAAWFALALVPLLAVLDDWNAWRTPLPGLGFGLAAVGFLGVAEPSLALAFVALRTVALLLAPPAPMTVAPFQPVTTSEMSFTRLVRLQRIAQDTRRVLVAAYPTLPPHADVRFQTLPRMAEVGLQGPLALRVWYADSTLTWRSFGGAAGLAGPAPYVVSYDTHRRWQPVVLTPAAIDRFARASLAMNAGNTVVADSLFVAAQEAQPVESDEFTGAIAANRARIAFNDRRVAQADSLNQAFLAAVGPVAEFYALQSAIELAFGHYDEARRDAASCDALEPGNATVRAVKAMLAKLPPAR
jgi:hypothetical protein